MAGGRTFEVEGVVVEALANGTYTVELANGHRLVGFVAGRFKNLIPRLKAGDKINLELSPYDLSEGRILVETQTI